MLKSKLKKCSRVLALLLIMLLAFGLIPAQIFADEFNQASFEHGLTQAQLEALDEISHERVNRGVIGFEGDYALVSDDEFVSVIVVFESAPAGVQMLEERVRGRMMTESAAEAIVEADHALFRSELSDLFSQVGTTPFSAADSALYSITWEFRRALNGVVMEVPAAAVAEIARFESVRVVYPNVTYYLDPIIVEEVGVAPRNNATGLFPDPLGMSSGRANMGANDLHRMGIDGTGILVAVLDTGVDYHHPTFADSFPTIDWMNDRLADMNRPPITPDNHFGDGTFRGRNFIDDSNHPRWIPGYVRNDYDPMETHPGSHTPGDLLDELLGSTFTNHGTHVAGTIAGRLTNNMLGIAPGAYMIHYRVLGPNGGSQLGSVIAGIEAVYYDRPDVVNLSLGAANQTPWMDSSIAISNISLQTGAIFVVAAGNSGHRQFTMGTPATSPLAIAVANFTDTRTAINSGGRVGLRLNHDNIVANTRILTGGLALVDTDGPNGRFVFEHMESSAGGTHNVFIMPRVAGAHPIATSTVGVGSVEDFAALVEEHEDDLEGAFVLVHRPATVNAAWAQGLSQRAYDAGLGGVLVINHLAAQISQQYQGTAVPLLALYNTGDNLNGNALIEAFEEADEDYIEIYFDDWYTMPHRLHETSSRGPTGDSFFDLTPDIGAHGSSVFSANSNFTGNHENAYFAATGTSMSSPHVAGGVALLLHFSYEQHGTQWGRGEVKARIMNTATPADHAGGNYGVTDVGAGVINVYAAAFAEEFVSVDFPRATTSLGGWTTVRHGSFSFGGIIPGESSTLTAWIRNTTNESRTYEISYAFLAYGRYNVPPGHENEGTITIPSTLTVPAGQEASFLATLAIPVGANTVINIPSGSATADRIVPDLFQGHIYVHHQGVLVARLPFGGVAHDAVDDVPGITEVALIRDVITTDPTTAAHEGSNILGITYIQTEHYALMMRIEIYEYDDGNRGDLMYDMGYVFQPGMWVGGDSPRFRFDVMSLGVPFDDVIIHSGPQLPEGDYILVLNVQRGNAPNATTAHYIELPFAVDNTPPEITELTITTGVAAVDAVLDSIDVLDKDGEVLEVDLVAVPEWDDVETITISGNVFDQWLDDAITNQTTFGIFQPDSPRRFAGMDNIAVYALLGDLDYELGPRATLGWPNVPYRLPILNGAAPIRVDVDANGDFEFELDVTGLAFPWDISIWVIDGYLPTPIENITISSFQYRYTWAFHQEFIPGFVRRAPADFVDEHILATTIYAVAGGAFGVDAHGFMGGNMTEFGVTISVPLEPVQDIVMDDYEWLITIPLDLHRTHTVVPNHAFSRVVEWSINSVTPANSTSDASIATLTSDNILTVSEPAVVVLEAVIRGGLGNNADFVTLITIDFVAPELTLRDGSGIWRPIISGFVTPPGGIPGGTANDIREWPSTIASHATGRIVTRANLSPFSFGFNDSSNTARDIRFYIGPLGAGLNDPDTHFHQQINDVAPNADHWNGSLVRSIVGGQFQTIGGFLNMGTVGHNVVINETAVLPDGVYTLHMVISNFGHDLVETFDFVITSERPTIEFDETTFYYNAGDTHVTISGSVISPGHDLAIYHNLVGMRDQATLLTPGNTVPFDYAQTRLRFGTLTGTAVPVNADGTFSFELPIAPESALAPVTVNMFVSDGTGRGMNVGTISTTWNQPVAADANRSVATPFSYVSSTIPTVTDVEVYPLTANVVQGETQQFTATVIGTNNPPQTVTWTVADEDGDPVTGASIDADGLLTVDAAVSAGTTLIVTATSTLNTAVFGTAEVTVDAAAPQPIVTDVEVYPLTANVVQGDEQQFTATVIGTNNPPQTVTWSVADSAGVSVTGASIDADGLLTVDAAVPAQTILIVTATSTFDDDVYGYATVTVTAPAQIPEVISVTVTPSVIDVQQGETQQFTATVDAVHGADDDVEWSVTGHLGASISTSGLLTVGATVPTGTILIVTATSTFDDDVYGYATVTVTAPAQIPEVISVTVIPSVIDVQQYHHQGFSAIVLAVHGADETVEWSVADVDGDPVTGATINQDGLLIITAEVPGGTTLIVTATSAFDDAVYGYATVTVTAAVLSITVYPLTAYVMQGETQQFIVDLSAAGSATDSVHLTVSGHAEASIDAFGLLTVGANVPAGTILTVRATSTVDDDLYGEATVTVTAPAQIPEVISVTVTPSVIDVQQGHQQQFEADVVVVHGADDDVEWSVADPAGVSVSGATINQDGLLTIGANVPANTILIVTATSTFDDDVYGYAAVIVTAPPITVTDVIVTPAVIDVQQGDTQQFTATVIGTNNPPQTVTWTVTDSAGVSVTGASIGTDGLLTVDAAVPAGTILIVTAVSTLNTTVYGQATVTVTAPPATVISVSVTPNPASVRRGENLQLSANVVVTGNADQSVTWIVDSVDPPSTEVSIDGNGLLSVEDTVDVGTVITVTATSVHDPSVSGTATITVLADDADAVTGITITPPTANVIQGDEQQFTAVVTVVGSATDDVTWNIVPSVAGADIDNDGLLTVDSSVHAGTVIDVRVTSLFDPSMYASAAVMVVAAQIPDVISITVSPSTINVQQGNQQQFTASVNVVHGAPTTVEWTATDADGDSVPGATVSTDGLLTVSANVTAQTILIVTATSTHNQAVYGYAEVTVTAANVQIPTHMLTVINTPVGGISPINQTTSGNRSQGSTVSLTAGTRAGFTFSHWSASPNVTFANAASQSTTFVMPATDIIITAVWTQILDDDTSNYPVDRPTDDTTGQPGDQQDDSDTDEDTDEDDEPTQQVDADTDADTDADADADTDTDADVATTQFNDIHPSDWFYDVVASAVSQGFFRGMSDYEFAPNASMSRAMLVTVLANLMDVNLEQFAQTEALFGDVDTGSWYFAAVQWAASMGITTGVGDNTFGTDAPITREQIAVMLYRFAYAAGIELNTSPTDDFVDQDDISPWARDAVAAIRAAGIIFGRPDGTFDPQATATRAEVAAMIVRFAEGR